mgnify:CR=1 FL=1
MGGSNTTNPIEKLIRVYRKKVRRVVGLMSGTSADGVSAVLVEISGSGLRTEFRILAYETYPYPPEIRRMIFELFNPSRGSVDKVCFMNFVLGELFARAAIRVTESAGYTMEEVDLIGSHGQTVYHIPQVRGVDGVRTRSTLQVGEPSVIAERTGVLTIADFRPRDVAAGGEGAPITAYVDYLIFRSDSVSRAIQNIGGIANVTFIPRGASIDDIVAFDTGPGNMLIDAVVQHLTSGEMMYDEDGVMASRGMVSEELLSWLMEHPFIKRRPPKTTGREDFGEHFAMRVVEKAERMGVHGNDLVATVTAFTARSIAHNYREFLEPICKVDEVVVGGGGALNRCLMRMLKEELRGVKVSTHEDYGIPAQAKEPLAMAILANEAVSGNFNNVPTATGARKRVVMGKILLPS